jgi:hypothetical protein
MQYVALQEEGRDRRRTVADALDVVGQELGLNEITRAEIRLAALPLLRREPIAAVQVLFPTLQWRVSLPAATRFQGSDGTSVQLLEITRLEGAKVNSDGAVLLMDGTRLRAVEVVPARLPHKVSTLEMRILRHLIEQTHSDHCYRSMRDGLPEHMQRMTPDLRAIDYARLASIQAPPLKVIRGYIEDHEPELRVSNQKISDTLASVACGYRTDVGPAASARIRHGIATVEFGLELVTSLSG